METQKKSMGKTVALALAGALASGCATPIEFKPGFNAVYAGLHSKREEGYARVFTGASVGNDTLRVYHHGLNEVSGEDTNTYFGRNIFGVEPLNIGIEAIVDMRGNKDGLFDGQPYYGARDFNSVKMLGSDWGFLQGTTNGENGNLTMLYGKNMGFLSESLRPLSVELFHTYEYGQDGKDSNYSEITADWNIFGNFGIFVRQDISEFSLNDANYVIGGVLKL
ncbi:hypothetical protein J4423_00525 [Candidatus Pacearchaeota archaeon]|nr:hypothetical protein [Candidatus Pacearchaeota archaeon]